MMDMEMLKPLPPFSWHEASSRDMDKEYFNFYHIDFSSAFGPALQHHFGFLALGGYDIAVHYFTLESNTKTVVFNHGYYDHVGLYGHLIGMLLEQGCNVLAYDLPGHGLSSGERAGISSFAEYQKVLAALLEQARPHLVHPLYLVGQSTGGAIAMDYVMHHQDHGLKGMILLAPLVLPERWLFIRVVLSTLGLFMSALPREFSHNSHDEKFLHFVKNVDTLQSRMVKKSYGKALVAWQNHFHQAPGSSLPTLLIQGTEDRTVDWQYNLEQIDKKFTHVKVVKLAGAMHHLANETEMYRQQIRSALAGFLQAG